MSDLEFPRIPELDSSAMTATAEALRHRPRRLGHLGFLSQALTWWAGCTSAIPLNLIQHPALVVFAGATDIEPQQVSDQPAGSVNESLAELESGAGPYQLLRGDTQLEVVDLQDHPVPDFTRADTLGPHNFSDFFRRGQDQADALIDSGCDLLIPGSVGESDLAVAATLIGALSRREPVSLFRLGDDPELWKRRVEVSRNALYRVFSKGLRATQRPPATTQAQWAKYLCEKLGSATTAALSGFFCQTAARRTPVLFDGPHCATAALIAERLCPGTRLWLQLAQSSAEPMMESVAEELELQPLMITGTDLPEGAASLMALPQLQAGISLVRGDRIDQPQV
ncbi:hypothetical protein GP475_08005 [Corynebacterium poyangense]|uniref:Uncharacterized protein n=1 Tax=Corynebacterium poyangense TaxID=2684405 RepID=A0A7H0SPW3_9CORY|nr:nicotinate-nucleotide--dimethylbenzimidazole phosphoribosyltransferase [Corynebacterium poyangense]MBZ8178181.1 hypothetical protein [Corynebacterium poyangense]QNQ90588.1 hypothetical protein GP475_08005 [Corynebacterium poyangense]